MQSPVFAIFGKVTAVAVSLIFAVKGKGAIAVDRDGKFRYIFLLPPESITHAIPRVCNIRESNGRGGLANFLCGAFDLLVCNFNVLVKVHGTIASEDQVHVQNERNASFVVARERGNCQSLFGQLEIWPTVAVKGEGAIAVDRDGKLRYIFLLPPESITHAIPSVCNIRESNGRGGLANFLCGAFDLLVCNFNVLVKVHGTIAREDQVHVQNERNASFVVARERGNCQSLLGQLEIWPTVAVEGERAVTVDRDGEFGHIFLLPPESITHAIPS